MKMSNLFRAGALSIVALTALWSCKDDFTEEDLLDKQAELNRDNINLSIVVYNASTSFTGFGEDNDSPLGGRSAGRIKGSQSMIVSLMIDGKIVADTTDALGIAYFEDLQPGSVSGTITGTGFTTVNFALALKEGKSANGTVEPETIAGAIIPVFETVGPNTATVAGRVTCELNLLNNDREPVPNGTTVSFSINTASKRFKELFEAILKNDLENEGFEPANASVEKLSFESDFVAEISNGQYTIQLPVSQNGLDYDYSFSNFEAQQTIAFGHFENEPETVVASIGPVTAQFGNFPAINGGNRFDIPFAHPVQFDIAAPPAAGTGAALTVHLQPTGIAGALTDIVILHAGFGYPANTSLPIIIDNDAVVRDLSVAGSAVAVLQASTNALGQITSVTGTLGAGYKGQAVLRVNSTPAAGAGNEASLRVNYASTVMPLNSAASQGTLRTTLVSEGSGYFVTPEIVFSGRDFEGDLVTEVESAIVVGGRVVSFGIPTSQFATRPSVTIRTAPAVQAIPFGSSANSVGSAVSGSVFVTGTGYDPFNPPAVTVTGLRGGSGATAVATVNAGGGVTGVTILNSGSGYSTLSNANVPSSAVGFSAEASPALVLKPGSKTTVNAYYGTGVRVRGLIGQPISD